MLYRLSKCFIVLILLLMPLPAMAPWLLGASALSAGGSLFGTILGANNQNAIYQRQLNDQKNLASASMAFNAAEQQSARNFNSIGAIAQRAKMAGFNPASVSGMGAPAQGASSAPPAVPANNSGQIEAQAIPNALQGLVAPASALSQFGSGVNALAGANRIDALLPKELQGLDLQNETAAYNLRVIMPQNFANLQSEQRKMIADISNSLSQTNLNRANEDMLRQSIQYASEQQPYMLEQLKRGIDQIVSQTKSIDVNTELAQYLSKFQAENLSSSSESNRASASLNKSQQELNEWESGYRKQNGFTTSQNVSLSGNAGFKVGPFGVNAGGSYSGPAMQFSFNNPYFKQKVSRPQVKHGVW